MGKSKEEKNTSRIIANMEKIAVKLFFAAGFLLFAACGFPGIAKAANLYLSPVSGSYEVGKSFSVSVFVSSPDRAMNAADGVVSFSSDKLEVTSLSKSGSTFSLWVLEPSFSNSAGTINFEGVVMNPGFIGASGKILTINFKTKAVGQATLNFSSGSILANDGEGTNILNSLGSAKFNIISSASEEPAPSPKKEEVPAKEEAPAKEEVEKVEEAGKPVITSPTHPDQTAWYAVSDAKFKWDLPYGTTGVSILLDEKDISNPGSVSDGLFSSKDYEKIEDGVWYLHLKLKVKSVWTETSNYKVQIDTTPPLPFEVTVDIKEGAGLLILHFETTDATSGIDKYEIKLDGKVYTVGAGENSFEVPSLSTGENTAIVKALDKAGNETLAFVDFTIEPIEAPLIKNYPQELKSSDQLLITGTALPEVKINLFIQSEKTGKTVEQSGQSDKDGNWNIVYPKGLANGKYFAWAEAVNSQGRKSGISNKISFLVTPPIFIKIGSWAINYFTIFIILLIFLILIIALLAYWAGMIRGRLKKETDEAQKALHSNLKEFRRLIEKELSYLESLEGKRGYEKERTRMKRILRGRVDFVEGKISKEIKDVQDLLK